MRIEITDYDPSWPAAFEKEKINLQSLLGSNAVAIEHVGSTAVPGLKAKPVIDIFTGVTPFHPLPFYKKLFPEKDYQFTPAGMSNRYLFAKTTNGIWTHNIHIMPYNDEFYLRNELLLRDYLRRNPEWTAEYGEVKMRCAREHGDAIEKYTRAKTGFIQKAVDAARSEKGLPLENVWEE